MRAVAAAFALDSARVAVGSERADETCQLPYLPKIVGQGDFLYVWTLGVEGVGDGSASSSRSA